MFKCSKNVQNVQLLNHEIYSNVQNMFFSIDDCRLTYGRHSTHMDSCHHHQEE